MRNIALKQLLAIRHQNEAAIAEQVLVLNNIIVMESTYSFANTCGVPPAWTNKEVNLYIKSEPQNFTIINV
jgi:hypothetical protein